MDFESVNMTLSRPRVRRWWWPARCFLWMPDQLNEN